ncbi:MAG: glycoside hydrolase family 3 C-terminal domain-containing protein [Clostridiales bacterium]|nr:glycoside hydrolase family 3 C-terminal domain-containing protein [Clostridiales bacterium]
MEEYERLHNDIIRKAGGEFTVLLRKDGRFPLGSSGKIALYGSGIRHTIKGGTGSGEVNSRFFVNIEEGIRNAGFEITTEGWLDRYDEIRDLAWKAFVKEVKRDAHRKLKPAAVESFGRSMREPEYDIPADGEGDTAVYAVSRISGEGADRNPVKGDILLTDSEIRDILACNDRYDNFMLVINAGGVVDLSPVRDVKNILILSQLGVVTGDILADILLGRSVPSGKLTTTWTSWEHYPEMIDFGSINNTRYKEGIFVGYRYFDSMGEDVLFPFGFGLSYTDFDMTHEDIVLEGDLVTVTASVKNEGEYPGKEVVQIYVSKPQVRLCQPRHELAAFVKTELIAPGEVSDCRISFAMRDIASYDEEREVHILEKGDYIVYIGNSSQDLSVCGVIRLEEDVITAKAPKVGGTCDFDDFIPEVYGERDQGDAKVMVMDPDVISIFDPEAVDEMMYDGITGGDEIGKKAVAIAKAMTDDELIHMNIGAFDPKAGIASIVGNSGFTVPGAAGETYRGPDGKIPSLVMADGPAGLRLNREYAEDKDGKPHSIGYSLPESFMYFIPKIVHWVLSFKTYKPKPEDKIKNQYCTAIPIGTAIAQSFNTDLAEKLGDIVGDEMERFGIRLWLAPALNIHRSIRCGRNFEYFSEDPVISGKFAAAITVGVQKHPGCGTVIKHYVANNQETERIVNNSMMSERTLREIYLKGFAIAIKDSSPVAVMTSYNLLNGIHTGEHKVLIDRVLRQEFLFDGIVMTDWVIDGNTGGKGAIHPLSNAPDAIMSGSNLFMPGSMRNIKTVRLALATGKVTRKQLEINAADTISLALKFEEDIRSASGS